MAQYRHLALYKTTYDLLIALMHTVNNFPREYKYLLGEKIQKEILELLIEIYKANSAKDKKAHIEKIMEHSQFLDLYLRICRDLKIISIGKYSEYIEKAVSISKQAGGWLNSCKETLEKTPAASQLALQDVL